ncbi:MAG: hypothetical protein OEZ29_02730 [Candidatus Bathyarchaeota archaeon]|nr:hypothetical protein [Candidatus Bathyarchaeota archaeon]
MAQREELHSEGKDEFVPAMNSLINEWVHIHTMKSVQEVWD